MFDGYTEGSSADGKTFHDGFMASGDMGYMDPAGRLFVVGRDDEMIASPTTSTGSGWSPSSLAGHPDVAEASVVGVPDDEYGQRLVAFVVPRQGASADADTLRRHVRDTLANYKVPREVIALEELPRNATGKILRAELRARAGG